MKSIVKEFYNVGRGDKFELYFLSDLHVGHPGCDEQKIRNIVQEIKDKDNAYWIGTGDQLHLITLKDEKRFDTSALAKWLLTPENLCDIPAAQRDRFLNLIEPIANKCLGLGKGNHEDSIEKYRERTIHKEVCDGIRRIGNLSPTANLDLGYSGWLLLRFYRSSTKSGATTIKVYFHHGWSTGQAAFENLVKTTVCDILVVGHSHQVKTTIIPIRDISKNGTPLIHQRHAIIAGTMQQDYGHETWGEKKGHIAAIAGSRAVLTPGAENLNRRIQVVTQLY